MLVGGFVVTIVVEAKERFGFGRVGTAAPATTYSLGLDSRRFRLGFGLGNWIERGFFLDTACTTPSVVATTGFLVAIDGGL